MQSRIEQGFGPGRDETVPDRMELRLQERGNSSGLIGALASGEMGHPGTRWETAKNRTGATLSLRSKPREGETSVELPRGFARCPGVQVFRWTGSVLACRLTPVWRPRLLVAKTSRERENERVNPLAHRYGKWQCTSYAEGQPDADAKGKPAAGRRKTRQGFGNESARRNTARWPG